MNAAPNIHILPSPNSDFDRFWAVFPRRVAKLAAIRAWAKALRLAAADEIIAGVERYKRHKPDYADWCHPATWLNAGRWMDDYSEPTMGITRQNTPSRAEVISFAKSCGDSKGYVMGWLDRHSSNNFKNANGDWRSLFKAEFERHKQLKTP